jgi:hypothetical protein
VVRTLGPQAVGLCEIAIHVTRVHRSDRRQLMDDHIGPCCGHGVGDLMGIKRIRDHRHSAQRVEHRLVRRVTRHAMNLMTRGDQARHQLLSNRSRRTRHEHSHHQLLDRGLPAPHKTGRQPRL